MEYSNAFVCLLGLGTVFFGLIVIILLCNVIGVICRKKQPDNANLLSAAEQEAPTENRQELIAAISAALAENLGTDVSGIRILSVKKL